MNNYISMRILVIHTQCFLFKIQDVIARETLQMFQRKVKVEHGYAKDRQYISNIDFCIDTDSHVN